VLASIIAAAMRSLTLCAGLQNSSLTATVPSIPAAQAIEANQRRVADQFRDIAGDFQGHPKCLLVKIRRIGPTICSQEVAWAASRPSLRASDEELCVTSVDCHALNTAALQRVQPRNS
jgi:hypothetical protein